MQNSCLLSIHGGTFTPNLCLPISFPTLYEHKEKSGFSTYSNHFFFFFISTSKSSACQMEQEEGKIPAGKIHEAGLMDIMPNKMIFTREETFVTTTS